MDKVYKLEATAEEFRSTALRCRKQLMNLPEKAPRFVKAYYILKFNALEWLANEFDGLADDEYEKVITKGGN